MKKIKLSILFLFAAFFINAQNGQNDPTFNTFDNGLYGDGFGYTQMVKTTSIQPDGKIIAGGDFITYNRTSINRIARVNTDGSIDSSFSVGSGFNSSVYTTSIQPDGKIIVGGDFTSYNGTPINRIIRLNPNGSVDPTFNPGVGFNANVRAICLQPDGKIIVGGSFTSFNGSTINRIVRLNSNGSLDVSFNTGSGFDNDVYSLNLLPDGRIIVGGGFTSFNGTSRNRIARLNANGSLDATFTINGGFNNWVFSTEIQTDGKIIAGGWFSSFNGISRNRITRLNTDGSIDPTFNPGTGFNWYILAIKIQADGKIITGGKFDSFNGMTKEKAVRLNTDGSLDSGFDIGYGFNEDVYSIAIQTNGKLIISGNFSHYNRILRHGIARLNTDGSIEEGTFNFGSGFNDMVSKTAVQSDGKILVVGIFNAFNAVSRNGITRLNTDGSIDSTFNPGTGFDNQIGFTTQVSSISIQPDGKIIIGGHYASYNGTPANRIVRLNTDGSIDPTFDPGSGFDNAVFSSDIQSDGKIVVGGAFTSFDGVSRNGIARLNADGSIDPTFDPGSGFNYTVYQNIIQPDGKIIVTGSFSSFNGSPAHQVARLNSDGTLDPSFIIGNAFNDNVYCSALQPDGKILIGGAFTSFQGVPAGRIVRLNVDGSMDPSFDTGSGFETSPGSSGALLSILVQPDGKIIASGGFIFFNGAPHYFLARLNSDGSIDSGFNPNTAPATVVFTTDIQADGKILLTGTFNTFDGIPRTRIARLLNCDSPATRTDTVHHSCPFTWIDGNVYTSGTTTATFTIPGVAANDCDSIITLNLTLEDSVTPIPDMAALPDILATCAVTTLIPPTATDNCGGTLYATHNTVLPITFQGTSLITWTYDDGNGNTTTQTQNIVISAIDNSVNQNALILTANYSGQSYQWIDCGNGNIPLPGETNQTFTASENGSYAVVINDGICSDTSACILIDFVGIEKLTDHFNVTAYPNPTNGTLTITASEPIQTIQIQNIIGQEVNRIQNIEQGNYQLKLPVDPGVYLLVVTTRKGSKLIKVINE